MRLRYHPAAKQEAFAAAKWFRRHDPPSEQRFKLRLQSATRKLRQNPELGAALEQGFRRLPLSPFPYVLIYELSESEVIVIAVAHGKQEPSYWSGRRQPSPDQN